jgi:hypothetical protein
MANPQINHKDEFLYEHLTLIIQEFEETALKSGTREGLLIIANSPLQTMDQVLESSSKALVMNRTKKVNRDATSNRRTSSSSGDTSNQSGVFVVTENTEAVDSDGFLPTIPNLPSITLNTEKINESTSQSLIGGEESLIDLSAIEFDEDMKGLTGEGNLQDFLKDCIGCDFRVTFDWQLKPIDLLGPIADLVKDINLALDGFETQMDPFAALQDLCDILNNTNWLCLPDLMAILMALKLLLKSYLSFQLSINLDWTVIIGPLLKIILDAIASLIQAIAGVLLGPLDCVIGALKSIAEMEKQIRQVAGAAMQVSDRIVDRANQTATALNPNKSFERGSDGSVKIDSDTEISGDVLYKDVAVVTGDKGAIASVTGLQTPALPSLKAGTRTGNTQKPQWSEWSFPSGVNLTDKVKLPDSIKDPRFSSAHWTTKIIIVIQEAKDYILNLVRKIIGSVNSLKGLVSGGLGIQLGNLGLLLFVKDMIALVILIIKLLSSNKNVKDWCEHLQKHPEILEDALDQKVSISNTDRALVLAQGPKIVGTIKTCSADTSGPQQQMLNQWIADLKRGTP